MSLNNISLPASVLVELYKDLLVQADTKSSEQLTPAPSSVISPARPVLRYLGNHLKKITLIVESADASFLPEPQLNFIVKMLEACKLNMGDVAIINFAGSPVSITELGRELSPHTVLLFGLDPTRIKLPFHIPPFKIQEYDQRRFLFVPALDEINQDTSEGKLLKTKLWLCLKSLFQV